MNQKLMKKSLITLAVLGAFAGAAQAQTTSVVTLYGTFDGGIRNQSNVNAAGDSRTTMGSTGTYNSNRIGFKDTEDLGGGNNAHFNLETGFNTGTGALDNATNQLFSRTATVGMGGSWGSLDLGRQYTVAFRTIGTYDPFNYKYTGIIPVVTATAGVRNNNDVQYAGTFGPITARAEYALGESNVNRSRDATQAIGVGYSAGPVTVGYAHTEKKPGGFDYKHDTVGGAFTMSAMRVAVGYAKDSQKTATVDSTRKDVWGGLSFMVTPGAEITGAYYKKDTSVGGHDGTMKQFIVGGTYAFSKRTNLYADYDTTKFSGIAITAKDKSNGVSVGINHAF